MNALLDQLFGTSRLAFGGEGVAFDWARPVPGWGWLLVGVGVVVIASAVYRGVEASRLAKLWMATLRAALLALIAVLASGPQLLRQPTTTEPDWLVVLADRSASLTVADAPGNTTREQQLRDTLERLAPQFRDLDQSRNILWLGFDRSAFEIGPLISTDGDADAAITAALAEPTGRETRLAEAVDQGLRRIAGRPLAGVLVLSDGRSADVPSEDLLARLQAEQVPVFSLPLGGAAGYVDRSIERVEAPEVVFAGDTVPVRAWARRSGDEAADGPVRLQLVDTATDRVLAEAEAEPGEPAVLLARPDDIGERDWAVRVVDTGPDLIPANDAKPLAIEIVDRPIRVLFIDGYPRWEQRYLKSLLLREASIRSTSVLLAADRQYQQDGDVQIERLPISAEEWAEFDVVIMGDVRSDLFGSEQLAGLREHISGAGAGLLWSAGPAAVPQSWRTTELADLLPIRSGPADAPQRPWGEEVTLVTTPAADLISLLRGGAADAAATPVADPALGWTLLRWAQRIDPGAVKPAAEVLAMAVPVSQSADPTPLVVSMRYGTGRSAYIATDETWRWRYGRGEAMSERFWIPMLRLLARNRLARAGRSAILTATPSPVLRGEPARVELDLIDQALIDAAPQQLRVIVSRGETRVTELTLTRPDGPAEPGPGGNAGSAYAAPWVSNAAGRYTFRTDEPILSSLDLTAAVEVIEADDELRFPQADRALLEQLADATGGAVLGPEDEPRLADLLPNRSIVVPSPPEIETLWDKPWALVAVLVLLSLELVTRRLVRLP